MADLIREIEDEGEERRGGDEVAGALKILSQNPHETPTRKTKRSTKPLFHVASKQARVDLETEFLEFLARYWESSAASRGGNLKAAGWFPEGCFPPALAFTGPSAPPRPPSPPTRRIETLESGEVERGNIPIVEISVPVRTAEPAARARGQPP